MVPEVALFSRLHCSPGCAVLEVALIDVTDAEGFVLAVEWDSVQVHDDNV